jgi:hypothetical protein
MDPEERLEAAALNASLLNPADKVETTLHTDAVSVGITDYLAGTKKRLKWTAENLKRLAPTFKNMPITAKIMEDGKLEPHSTTIIGNITGVHFDEGEGKIKTDGILWNHYYPDTIAGLQRLYDDGAAEVSMEFEPTLLTASPEDGEDVFIPEEGRFVGLAIVGRGADRGNAIRLLASAMEREDAAVKQAELNAQRPGSFEWVAVNVAERLAAGAEEATYVPKTVVATYPDRTVYQESGKYYALPYTITGSTLVFSDTIEVEPTFQPLGASAAGSVIDPEVTPTAPVKEAEKPVDPEEIKTLKAAADKVPTLEAEIATLKAAVAEGETAKTELETLKAAQAAEAETRRRETLAASRLEEVEKIKPYEDASQKKEDLEAFKTMDDSAFEIVKRVLAASAGTKGGVANEGVITAPVPTREDPDGAAAAILESDDFKRLTASLSGTEDK